MTTQLEQAARLALEALKKARRKILTTEECHAVCMNLTAALADNALERKAENARELGLDYEHNGGKTGWPPGLLQDDHSGLSRWLASKPDARQKVRKSLEQSAQQQGSHTFYDGEGNVVVRLDTTGDITMDYTNPSEWAKPAQDEPVAVWELFEDGWDSIADPDWMESLPVGTKLYTRPQAREPQPCPYVISTREGTHHCSLSQREWVGLTDEERIEIRSKVQVYTAMDNIQYGLAIQHATETKLKDKNT